MANYTAADVKRLREETDAPMMECKQALDEADGNYDRAKEILREKGKAAAAKRVDKKTSEGVVALATAHDHKSVGAVVLECETDFVARNEDFVALAQEIAEIFLHNNPGSDPLAVKHGDKNVGEIVVEAVAKIRENIRVAKAEQITSENKLASYIHHDRKKAVVVELKGDASNAMEAARSVAIQSVAFPPEFLKKDEVPQDFIDKEIEIETQRAIGEGKDANIAKNIAQGRVNKEFMKRAVLLEQPFYKDSSKNVSEFLKEEAKNGGGSIDIVRVIRLAVGEGE
ncbi:MAG TPA: translation elongation factor Ts [Fimbriimonadaceae bacterium]|jgi:elongation factor Ts